MPILAQYLTILTLPTILISALYIRLPLHPTPLSNTTISFPTTNPGFGICDSLQTPAQNRPTFLDCQNAIRHRIPYSTNQATFHSDDGASDAFRLPVVKSWGSCAITIVLGGRGMRTESSSWAEIAMAATEVNEVCRVGWGSGGKIMAGVGGGVWIKLGRYGVGGEGGGGVEGVGGGREME